MDETGRSSEGDAGRGFQSTLWSVVRAAGAEPSDAAREALERLCSRYWFPLYAFARRDGRSAVEAEDATQGFFARFLERRDFARADPERGRFRSFLLVSFRHYLADERDHARAQRRGGGKPSLSLDLPSAEARYQAAGEDGLDPAVSFERRWAVTLLDCVLERLRSEYRRRDREALHERLRGFLIGGEAADRYADAARDLGMTEGAVKVAAHRLRVRFGELLRDEVAATVAGEGDVEDELRALLDALGRR